MTDLDFIIVIVSDSYFSKWSQDMYPEKCHPQDTTSLEGFEKVGQDSSRSRLH